MNTYSGSCLCRAITYECDGSPGAFGFCHCRSCQKASGSAFAANISVEVATFRFRTGEEVLSRYESSPGKFRCFCSKCGSPVLAYMGERPTTYRVRLGSVDTGMVDKPRCHFFISEKASWYEIADRLPQFQEWPDQEFLEPKGSKQGGS